MALPGRGPLGGIYSGLKVSDTDLNVVVACDMPFLSRDLIRYMVRVAPGHDAVIPRLGNLVEPLHAVYAMSSLGPIETKLRAGRLGVYKLFSFLNVRYVEEPEIRLHDSELLSFFNINTGEDLQRALDLAKEQENQSPL